MMAPLIGGTSIKTTYNMFGKNIMNWQIGNKFDITPLTGSFSVSQVGNDTLIEFSGSGTFQVSGTETQDVRFLMVGGGGGGTSGATTPRGGGGGKVIEFFKSIGSGTYSCVIGVGGAVGGNGGSTTISTGITSSIATGGLANGSSGNTGNIFQSVLYVSFPETRALKGIYNYLGVNDTVYGGGAGASLGVYTGYTSPAYKSATYSAGGAFSFNLTDAWVASNNSGDGMGGFGQNSTITGQNIAYGSGGSGGPVSGNTSTAAYSNGAGWISFNNGSPIAIAAEAATNYGNGGNGGARSSTLTAAASRGKGGVVYIRFTKK